MLNVSQRPKKLIKMHQNMTKLRNEMFETFVKSSLPEEPTLKLRMNVDILSYSKHDPLLKSSEQTEW